MNKVTINLDNLTKQQHLDFYFSLKEWLINNLDNEEVKKLYNSLNINL